MNPWNVRAQYRIVDGELMVDVTDDEDVMPLEPWQVMALIRDLSQAVLSGQARMREDATRLEVESIKAQHRNSEQRKAAKVASRSVE